MTRRRDAPVTSQTKRFAVACIPPKPLSPAASFAPLAFFAVPKKQEPQPPETIHLGPYRSIAPVAKTLLQTILNKLYSPT